jgi:hypothetical protein
MTNTPEHNNSTYLQTVVRGLLVGVVPERTDELTEMWNTYGPQFEVLEDSGPDGTFVMDAGAYCRIRFNHRILRVFWLSCFAAWEGYNAIHKASNTETGTADLKRFQDILRCIDLIRHSAGAEDIPLPDNIPEPGILIDAAQDKEVRAPGELAIFSVGWAFLHEIRHLMHQQEGTSTAYSSDAEDRRREEFSCDDFATRFLLEKAGKFAETQNASKSAVVFKRQIGIHFALFALAILGRDKWGDSEFHPATQRRIDNVLKVLEETGFSKGAAIISIAAFLALRWTYPDAPTSLDAVNIKATKEQWTAKEALT